MLQSFLRSDHVTFLFSVFFAPNKRMRKFPIGRQCSTRNWNFVGQPGVGLFAWFLLLFLCVLWMSYSLFTVRVHSSTWLGLACGRCWVAWLIQVGVVTDNLIVKCSWLLCRYSTCVLVQDEEPVETKSKKTSMSLSGNILAKYIGNWQDIYWNAIMLVLLWKQLKVQLQVYYR